eukprot:g2044.t1
MEFASQKERRAFCKRALKLAGRGDVEGLKKMAEIAELCAAVRGNSGESLLHRAAAAGADDLARAILETEFDANDRDAQAKTPLMEAATYGHASTAKILLERGARPFTNRTYSFTPLMYAASRNHAHVVQLLIDRAAGCEELDSTNREGMTALYLACREGATDAVEILIKAGASANICTTTTNRSPLQAAIRSNHVQVVKCLLQSTKVDLAHRDSSQRSVYHDAAEYNAIESLELLDSTQNSFHVNPQHVDGVGKHPIHTAADGGSAEALLFFLDRAGDLSIDMLDSHGSTPLMLACARGHAKCVAILLSHGASVFEKEANASKRTPLHLAAGFNHVDCVKALLKHGASPSLPDATGESAQELAERMGHKHIIQIF